MDVKGKYNDIHPEAEIGAGTDIWSWNYIGKCKIGKRCHITNWVHIGDYVEVGDDCNIQPQVIINSNVKIGNRVFIAGGACFTDIIYPTIDKHQLIEPCVVGDDVVIGNGSIILASVKVGDGAVIGAAALVTKDVPPNTVVYGVPAKIHLSRAEYDEKRRQHSEELNIIRD